MGILQASILEWVALSFSRGIFPTQGSNPRLLCLLRCRGTLHLLSHVDHRVCIWPQGLTPGEERCPGDPTLTHCGRGQATGRGRGCGTRCGRGQAKGGAEAMVPAVGVAKLRVEQRLWYPLWAWPSYRAGQRPWYPLWAWPSNRPGQRLWYPQWAWPIYGAGPSYRAGQRQDALTLLRTSLGCRYSDGNPCCPHLGE